MDIFIKSEKSNKRLIAIAEIKYADWDAMTLTAVSQKFETADTSNLELY